MIDNQMKMTPIGQILLNVQTLKTSSGLCNVQQMLYNIITASISHLMVTYKTKNITYTYSSFVQIVPLYCRILQNTPFIC